MPFRHLIPGSRSQLDEISFVARPTGPVTRINWSEADTLLSSLRPQNPGYAGIWRQFSRCEGRDRCGVHAAWPGACRVCATCILSGTHRTKLLTTPLYRLPLSSKPLKSLAESLRNRHGAHTPPQPSPAGRGCLPRATGARPIGASRMTADADAEAAMANPTPAADQPAQHRRPSSP